MDMFFQTYIKDQEVLFRELTFAEFVVTLKEIFPMSTMSLC